MAHNINNLLVRVAHDPYDGIVPEDMPPLPLFSDEEREQMARDFEEARAQEALREQEEALDDLDRWIS